MSKVDRRGGEPRIFVGDVMTFRKDDGEKPRTELLPAAALVEVSKVLAHGAEKYAPNNWRSVDDRERYTGAALRHLFEHMNGVDIDDESGLDQLAHAACSCLFLLESKLKAYGHDTRHGKPDAQNQSSSQVSIQRSDLALRGSKKRSTARSGRPKRDRQKP